MKDIAVNALDAAVRHGVSYADVRLIETQERHISTKNGKIGQLASAVSLGLGVRVLDRGSWGFAASDDLRESGIESAAELAVDIARASAMVKKKDVALAPEDKHEVSWTSPIRTDPFRTPVDHNLALLFAVQRFGTGGVGLGLEQLGQAKAGEAQAADAQQLATVDLRPQEIWATDW